MRSKRTGRINEKRARIKSGEILFNIPCVMRALFLSPCVRKKLLKYARDVAGSKFSVYRKYKDKWILLKVQMHTSLRSGRHFRPLQRDERSHGFRNICAYC